MQPYTRSSLTATSDEMNPTFCDGVEFSVTGSHIPPGVTTRIVAIVHEVEYVADWGIPAFIRSRQALDAAVLRAREHVAPAPPAVRARHGFQQMSRIPCYRGTRTR